MSVDYENLHKNVERKSGFQLNCAFLFRISSAVEQRTVNPLVVGSNPSSGAPGSYDESHNCFFYV